MELKTIKAKLSNLTNKDLVKKVKEEVKVSNFRVTLIETPTSANTDYQIAYGMTTDTRNVIGSIEKGQLSEDDKKIINANRYMATAVSIAGNLLEIEIAETEEVEIPTTQEENELAESVENAKAQALENLHGNQDALNERIKYLKRNGIDEDDILFAPALMLICKQDEEIEKPKKLYIHVRVAGKNGESLIKRILRNIILGNAVILEGPKSVGKNVAWESISWLLNRPLEVLNCNKKMTKADIFGALSTDASQKSGITLEGARAFFKSVFGLFKRNEEMEQEAVEFLVSVCKSSSAEVKLQKGPVSRALCNGHAKGTILIIDELNLSEPNLFAGVFNSLTDKHTTHYQINGLGQVKIPNRMIIGATQNGGAGYLGTERQNQATMSRFNAIRLTTLGNITSVLNETVKAEGLTKITPEIVDTLNRVYEGFATATKNKGASSEEALNVRGFERALGHINYGQSIKEAIKECVVNTCDRNLESTLTLQIDNIVQE